MPTPSDALHDPDAHTRPAPADGRRSTGEPERPSLHPSTPQPHSANQPTRPAPVSEPATLSGRPPIPGYEVEQLVGYGGMGVVYRARHAATNRRVALKLVGPRGAGDEITRERFFREVHTLARIKHPNIVQIFDAGEWHGFPFYTMEFVAGGTLNDHLDRFRRSLRSAVGLILKAARGVQVLHDANIIHRDLKPLNILIGPNDEPLVADFGLAKCLGEESDLTLTELPVGTRQYMAPEQTVGRRQDYTPACDVWALGVTLYEVLTGQRPFAADGLSDVYHTIRTTEPVPPTQLSADVPAPLQTIVLKCLAKRPEDRYQSATELADDLERWLRGEPILATLPPADAVTESTPALAPPRTKRRLSSVGAAAVIGLAAGTLALTQSQPQVTATVIEPRNPSIAERIEAGETVVLTNDKGFPLVEPVDEPSHALQRETVEGFRRFAHTGTGIANLLDQPLPQNYRVEALVGTRFHSTQGSLAGIYVGRRLWEGLPFKHESLFIAGVAPEFTNKQRNLVSCFTRYWWMQHSGGGTGKIGRSTERWHPEDKNETFRFAHVRVDVRGGALEATVDGSRFRPATTNFIAKDLESMLYAYRMHSDFPAYEFEAPFVGRGIGIFCRAGECFVRNLTVTKLAPTP